MTAPKGRPAKQTQENDSPEDRAKANLQYALDRACSYIADHPTTSYVARCARAARNKVPIEVALKGVEAMEAACADAREAIAKVYAPATKPEAPPQRVTL